MSLKATVQSAAVTAIAAVGDLAEEVTYVDVTDESDYEPTTNTISVSGIEYEKVKVLFVDYKEKDVGERIRSEDQQCLIPVLNFPDGSDVTPKAGDRIHRSETNQWEVLGAETDPAGALWVLHTRAVIGRDIV